MLSALCQSMAHFQVHCAARLYSFGRMRRRILTTAGGREGTYCCGGLFACPAGAKDIALFLASCLWYNTRQFSCSGRSRAAGSFLEDHKAKEA